MAGIVLEDPRIAEQDLKNRMPEENYCRECGDPAVHPIDWPEYCDACWRVLLRRRAERLERRRLVQA